MVGNDRRSHADRTAETRGRLVGATVQCLIECGYARTTSVEICRRAGVTRGAFQHHFANLGTILAAAMSDIFDRHFAGPGWPAESVEHWVDELWAHLKQPEFKAVIEVWLAVSNEPELAIEIRPVMQRYDERFSFDSNIRMQERIGTNPLGQAFYRLAINAMVGMTIEKARHGESDSIADERRVLELLRHIARTMVAPPSN